MKWRKILSRFLFLVVIFGLSVGLVKAQATSDTTQTDSTKSKPTSYKKLFKDKKSTISRGMIDLRKVDGKVYFEFPKKLLGRKMLLGSTVESTSNAADAAASEQPGKPLCIYFTQDDSTIHMRRGVFSYIVDKRSENIRDALQKNTIGPIVASFPIKAITPDSERIVFDATNIFVSGDENLDPFGPYSGTKSIFGDKTPAYSAGRSVLVDVKAYEQNITVTSYLSFSVSASFLGFEVEKDRPATFLMKRSLVLLPDSTARPRFSDPRIGVASSEYLKFSDDDNGIQPVKYANRWSLQPEDTAAFKRGELVEPVTPITFYIDDNFPDAWIDYVRQGVNEWNEAFGKIGFKNAIVTRTFPTDDPNFDPNDIAYNTVNYVLNGRETAQSRSWVDPRSGEIISASVSIYRGVFEKLRNDLFIQTAAANKKSRSMQPPHDLLGKAIRNVTMHEIGNALGLTNNYGASAAIPVDSLRSPFYTQKYGITASIMDGQIFNFIAQPGDAKKGVQLVQPHLGPYDYYAIKWLYQPVLGKIPEKETSTLKKWISEKVDDPMYRYHRSQVRTILDPHAIDDDLGDDQIKATQYAFKNLKYVLHHMNMWADKKDEDYSFRTEKNFNIINIQFYWYLRHVLNNIGGVYQYAKMEGDPYPAYKVVPEDVQKKSLQFLLENLENLSWLDDSKLEQNMNAINGDASEYIRSVLFPYVMNWGVRKLEFSAQKDIKNPYTPTEFMNNIFDYVWTGTAKGKEPSEEKLSLQSGMVDFLIQHAPIHEAGSSANGGKANAIGLHEQWALAQLGKPAAAIRFPANIENYTAVQVPFKSIDSADISDTFYYLLKKCQEILEQQVGHQKEETKEKYSYLLLKINKALEID